MIPAIYTLHVVAPVMIPVITAHAMIHVIMTTVLAPVIMAPVIGIHNKCYGVRLCFKISINFWYIFIYYSIFKHCFVNYVIFMKNARVFCYNSQAQHWYCTF